MRFNLYGGPGVGKSTTAAAIFVQMKNKGHRIELVTEYIKSWAWEKRPTVSYDQLYVFAKQLRREDILTRQGVHIVTDSPLPQQLVYAKKYNCNFYEDLKNVCKKFDDQNPSMNIFLKRTVPFQTEGRYETKEQAEAIDQSTLELLREFQPGFCMIDVTTQMDLLFNTIEGALKS